MDTSIFSVLFTLFLATTPSSSPTLPPAADPFLFPDRQALRPNHRLLFLNHRRPNDLSPLPPPSIACFISGSNGDSGRILRLLLEVYHPRNQYLLHLDLSASPEERDSLASTLHSIRVFKAAQNVNVVGKTDFAYPKGSSAISSALHVVQVGWKYGSATEDILTGLGIHAKGWRSVFCTTNPPSFLGCAPSCGPDSMIQMKRWATGLLEILFSYKSPILATINGNLQFRQCLSYMWLLIWGLRSIPELVYSLLPAYCLITGSRFLPKVYEPDILIPVSILVIYNAYTLSEYLRIGLSTRAWWNNQRMGRIYSTSSWLFAFLSNMLMLIGLSETAFEVTQKNQTTNDGEDEKNKDDGKFTFTMSPIFVPGTTILLINLTALVVGAFGLQPAIPDGSGVGITEMICCLLVVLIFWEYLKGMFGKGKYGIPLVTILKSGVLSLVFIHFCRSSVKASII